MRRIFVLFLILFPMVIYAKGGKKMKKKPELVYKEMADEAPEPLLYESVVYGAYYIGKWPDGWRILQNGEVWNCYDLDIVLEKGKYVDKENLPRIWRHWGQVVPPEDIERFKEFVRQNKILELPTELRGEGEGACIGGTNVFVTVEVDGKRHKIHWLQCVTEKPKIFKALQDLADELSRKAFDLWLDKYGPYWKRPPDMQKYLK